MFYVYILKSVKNGAYYVGSCGNIDVRIDQHNKGLVPSTKRYLPWDLVHRDKFDTLKGARRRELQIKSWKNRKAIENLIKHFKI
ncbi:MAG: endonuclease [Candidatus Portnoybacteria bacterium CG02_land_8_20_14_3_00_45_8]|uniref:Endonuclease n=1 Tax=Candidatus Portnoybacteria bacterium CG02_land_8_20_14_3_00_45_8 TaxID=1974807 RepID=A0A2M7D6H7_9BACT|nr:MAG: endonuclease [Candidatus Portnoybacteria bacterium CG02_land_8_20_14_3_00_45_8]